MTAHRSPRRPAPAATALLAGASVLLLATGGCGDDEPASTNAETTTTLEAVTTTEAVVDPTERFAPAVASVIAHRGASAYAPEHTFAAYDLAIEQGADYIEQDLQMTADGVLVVLHDDTLDRTARGPAESCTGPVATKTLAQLRECDAGSWFNELYPDRADPGFEGLEIPTLAEVFERYGPEVRYYIETKSPEEQPGMEQALLDLLDDAELAGPAADERQVLIQSFSAASLQLVHSLRPELPLVQLLPAEATTVDEAALADIAAYAVAIGPSRANVDETLVDAAHDRCLEVHPYTVDEPAEMALLLELGVDGLFTNVPDRLLEEREQHPAPPDHCAP